MGPPRTLHDPETFVCSQFWEDDQDDQRLWWNLKYLFVLLRRNGGHDVSMKFPKWIKTFDAAAQSVSGLPAPRVRPEAFEGIQNTKATADTLALVTFLFTAGDRASHQPRTRQSEMRAACIKYIRSMILKAS